MQEQGERVVVVGEGLRRNTRREGKKGKWTRNLKGRRGLKNERRDRGHL